MENMQEDILLTPETQQLLDGYSLPSPLGFGVELAPLMYQAFYEDGMWHPGALVPFGPLPINPAATCVQFGQQCFEGMKAYKVGQAHAELFRPEKNFQRFARSATRLSMPPVPADIFAEALSSLTTALEKFIPGRTGQSLYLRPTLLGLEHTFAVRSSNRFAFILIASPSDAYYTKPIRVMIEREQIRAAIGGTGSVKVGGNYAASIMATDRCVAAGYDQPLWLDAKERKYVEELSGMNFAAIIDGDLHMPALSGTILPGITRLSLIDIAARLGIRVHERSIAIDNLMDDIKAGACTELFACGTAAIISPISEIGEMDGTRVSLPDVGKVAGELRDNLLAIQEGRVLDDRLNWMVTARDLSAVRKRLH